MIQQIRGYPKLRVLQRIYRKRYAFHLTSCMGWKSWRIVIHWCLVQHWPLTYLLLRDAWRWSSRQRISFRRLILHQFHFQLWNHLLRPWILWWLYGMMIPCRKVAFHSFPYLSHQCTSIWSSQQFLGTCRHKVQWWLYRRFDLQWRRQRKLLGLTFKSK